MTQATCPQCSVPVGRTKPTGPSPTYCSETCRRTAATARDIASGKYAAVLAERKANRTPTSHDLTCHTCSKPMTVKRRDAKYCSSLCMEHGNVRRCSEPGCDKPHRAKGLCSGHYNAKNLPGSQRTWPAKPETRRRALRRKTQRRRALTHLPTAEHVDRDVVGVRDGWRCGVCRKRVNRALAWPDPMSPSLDHVVPLSQGGEHTYANSRITHWHCNHMRSNRGGGEQLALFG